MTDSEWDQFWIRQDAKLKREAQPHTHRSFDSDNTALFDEDDQSSEEEQEEEEEESPLPLSRPPPPPPPKISTVSPPRLSLAEEGGDDVGGEEESRSSASLLAAARSYAHRTAPRTNRCGACDACRAPDCGHCKECLDKPKFGGSGIRKKACISRVCTNANLLAHQHNTAAPSHSPPLTQPQPRSTGLGAYELTPDYQQQLFCGSPATAQGFPNHARRQPLTILDVQQPALPSNLSTTQSPDGTCRGALNILSASAVLAHQTPPPG